MKNLKINAFYTLLLSMLAMLVCISALTALILFASKAVRSEVEYTGAKVTEATESNTQTTKPTTTTPHTTSPDTTPPADTTTAGSDTPIVPTTPKKKIAVTFDDGPNGNMTYKFVDKLKEYGASATFFVVGNRMGQNNAAALKYALANGCEVGLHSFGHSYYNKMSLDQYLSDLQKTDAAINKYVSVDIRLMRPPGGILSTEQKNANPYTAIMWSVDSNDWQYTGRSADKKDQNVQAIVNNVLSVVKEGDIVLMHELYENSYEAFCIIIDELYKQGYELVTVGELLGDQKITAGAKYYNGR